MSEERGIREIRLEKLARMRELGHDPYAIERFERTASAKHLLEHFDELGGQAIRFAGRVVSYRLMGKAGFAHLSDGDDKIQAYFRKDDLGETGWELYNLLDIGDHVAVSGELFTTKTGEKTIHTWELTPLSKSLQVLPLGKEKEGQHWYGLTDVELRYRHRHLDLTCNPEARELLVQRSRMVTAVRRFFDSRGYLEVETPMLQTVAGGAAAKPFVAHYNAYDMDVKLRISLELYLKRLICGDLPKVYEIGRVFRNEGVSNRHNPEFSLLEFYEAYINMEDVMGIIEDLFRFVAMEVFGSTLVTVRETRHSEEVEEEQRGGAETGLSASEFRLEEADRATILDFSKPWKRVSLLEEIENLAGIGKAELRDLASAKKAMERVGIPAEKETNLGGIIEKLLERFVEPTLVQPTFVLGYPIETSPLAKKVPGDPRFTRRFEGYVRGREICNAFSEINDPVDQRERFEMQQQQMFGGDDEAHPFDHEYLFALEGGMPPTGGCGIGMERMAMALTGAEHIREILLFPMMKREAREEC